MQIIYFYIYHFPFFFFLLKLRETCLLIDPKDSSAAAKQYVALVVGEFNAVLA